MESTKRNFLIIFFILLLIAILTAGYFYFIREGQSEINIIRAIPENAVIVLKTESAGELWHNLSSTHQWSELIHIQSIQGLNNNLKYLDSITRGNARASTIIFQQPFILSLQSNNLKPLFIFALENTRHKRGVINYIKEITGNRLPDETPYHGKKIYSTNIKPAHNKMFYVVVKGLLILSFDLDVIKMSLDQLQSNTSLLTDERFQKVASTAGKKVEANIFINNNRFLQIFQSFLDTNLNIGPAFSNFASGWTALDLNMKDKELLLNGFSGGDDKTDFLQFFNKRESQNNKAPNILPSNTMFFFTLGVDDFTQYYEGIQKFKSINDSSRVAHQSYDEQALLQLISNEITIAFTEPPGQDISNYSFLLVHSTNSELLKEKINNTSASILEGSYYHKDIFRMSGANPMMFLFDPLTQFQSMSCFTVLEDWLVFAHDITGLKKFINYYTTGRTLIKNPNYQEFSDNIAESSNIYLYLNPRRAQEFINYAIREDFREFVMEGYEVFKLFEGPAIQFSSINDLFYTNIYLRYNPKIIEEEIFLWQTTLDTNIRKGPFLVNNHSTGNLNIIAIDYHNTMYMINPGGEIVWTRSLNDTILSDIHQIDFFRNNKVQYLFNTKSQIYLIDINGKDVAGYPVKLETPATNGLTILDYAGTKNYRIFIACENDRIYNYNKLGKRISGWKPPKLAAHMSNELKRLVINNKDYLIMPLDNGNVIMTDRKGKNKLTIKKSFVNSLKSDFYRNMTNSKGMMITTNNDGDLMYIPGSGSVQSTSFGTFSNEPYFMYEDMNEDGNPDFIFFDQSDLYIFNRLKKTLMHHEFDTPIDARLQILELSSGEKLIGLSNKNENKVYLFNINGLIDWSSKLKGNTPISIGALNNDGETNIIVGSDNVIFNYLYE